MCLIETIARITAMRLYQSTSSLVPYTPQIELCLSPRVLARDDLRTQHPQNSPCPQTHATPTLKTAKLCSTEQSFFLFHPAQAGQCRSLKRLRNFRWPRTHRSAARIASRLPAWTHLSFKVLRQVPCFRRNAGRGRFTGLKKYPVFRYLPFKALERIPQGSSEQPHDPGMSGRAGGDGALKGLLRPG